MENLTTWLLKQEQAGYTDTELTIVLSSISLACKQIASLLQRSNIINLTGAQGTINVQGEDQKKLDVISNELFCNCLRSSGRTRIIASEEEDVPVAVEETYSGNYVVVFDPIDGSANIDTSLTTGSIFGIYGPDKQCFFDLDDDSTYECAPMSYLVEQAGGKAIDGRQRILDIKPDQIHQRTPIYIGSPDEIDKLVKYLSS